MKTIQNKFIPIYGRAREQVKVSLSMGLFNNFTKSFSGGKYSWGQLNPKAKMCYNWRVKGLCLPTTAFYLPMPGALEYQFVYVDGTGRVCAQSSAFTFAAPKPLDELETVKEEQEEEEDGEEELLLVIPRAQLLQVHYTLDIFHSFNAVTHSALMSPLQTRLDECVRKQEDLQRALGEARNEAEREKEKGEKAKSEWERERGSLMEEISELRESLRQTCKLQKKEEENEKDVKYAEGNLTAALNELKAVKVESEQQITELQKELRALTERDTLNSKEMERLKERLKKMSNQMKHDEEKRKSLQVDRDGALMEVRGLQDRLEVSDHVTGCLRRELRELGTRQTHMHAELHQARMQVAQLTLQLSEDNLLLREERANWALEREAFKHAAEIAKNKLNDLSCELERKEEWLQEERMERERLEVGLSIQKDVKKEVMSSTCHSDQRMEMVSKSPLFCTPDSTSTGSNEDASSVTAHVILDRAFSCADVHTHTV
uniref:Calcium-binding and coiled-coil domain-containing protein 1-like n=1 Tax=Gouania willdenowi TaxID=441366 RepID=A0A8C5HI29_GOUWI